MNIFVSVQKHLESMKSSTHKNAIIQKENMNFHAPKSNNFTE